MKSLSAILQVCAASLFLFWLIGCDLDVPSNEVAPSRTVNSSMPQSSTVPRGGPPQVPPGLQIVMNIQNRHTQELMSDPDVFGTATGLDASGAPEIIILARRLKSTLPTTIEGVPAVVQVNDQFKSMGKGSTGGVSHTTKQIPPIQLGTSGGWTYDKNTSYCCGGTLGALVQRGGVQYVLSNSHVLWGDIVMGANNKVVVAGDPVVQPGLFDLGCNASLGQQVGTISGGPSLPGSNVDVGIAQVVPGMVRTDGAILEIGTISASPVSAFVGQQVKKSGRTTNLTRSSVSGLNATITVSFTNECSGATYSQIFTGQILVKNSKGAFLQSGDSGSLLVEDVASNPHAVGLMFASSSTTAVANPIGDVLNYLGATLVGN